MTLSIFLAKLIGLLLVAASGSLLASRKNVQLLFDLYKQPVAIFITGILETVLGIIFILNHNIWIFDFRGFITLIGWILLVRGVGRLFFPRHIAKSVEKSKLLRKYATPLLIFVLLLGAYLAYLGFTL